MDAKECLRELEAELEDVTRLLARLTNGEPMPETRKAQLRMWVRSEQAHAIKLIQKIEAIKGALDAMK